MSWLLFLSENHSCGCFENDFHLYQSIEENLKTAQSIKVPDYCKTYFLQDSLSKGHFFNFVKCSKTFKRQQSASANAGKSHIGYNKVTFITYKIFSRYPQNFLQLEKFRNTPICNYRKATNRIFCDAPFHILNPLGNDDLSVPGLLTV